VDIRTYEIGMQPIAEDSVVAIGVFDGVHLAHRELLHRAKEEAAKRRLPLYVFTFSAEAPTAKTSKPLYSSAEKCRLLASSGCDGVLLSPFSLVSSFSAERFVKEILLQTLGCSLAVCGFNFRFGAKASGDAATLSSLMAAYGKETLTVEPFVWNGDVLSTTRIRELLLNGDMKNAAETLGERYHLTGNVEHGRRLGHEIGLPTLNLSVDDGLFAPKQGVYAGRCEMNGREYAAVVNFGTCPTFGARRPHVEAHLLSPIDDCYGDGVKITLVAYLREERKFDSADALLKQIENDTRKARSIL